MTELNLNSITIETTSEKGDDIKEVVANKDRVEKLMRETFDLNVSKKDLDNELADKRSDLRDLLECLGITKITADTFTMSNIPSKRFSGWKDEVALLELIPEDLRGLDTMNPDRAKIEALVKAKKIPKAALELRHFKETKSIRFLPIVEPAQTD